MYNKSIQLHTSAEQNVTSGYYHTVGSLYKGNTGDVFRNVHTYITFGYKCTFYNNFTLVLAHTERPRFLVRIDDDDTIVAGKRMKRPFTVSGTEDGLRSMREKMKVTAWSFGNTAHVRSSLSQ